LPVAKLSKSFGHPPITKALGEYRHCQTALSIEKTMRLTTTLLLLLLSNSLIADDGLFGDDGAATVTGDILESRGDLARGLGKGALLRSMSAEQLQQAIAKRLENRKERVEQYYEFRDLRNEQTRDDADGLSASQRREIVSRSAPDRLNENQINRETGELYWPRPLDHESLKPYRKPIEETLAKRTNSDEVYRRMDYLKVHRMVDLIREAVESIEDKLDVKEVVALKDYLTQIEYEARFNAADERVDY
jgi:hypothetical protein